MSSEGSTHAFLLFLVSLSSTAQESVPQAAVTPIPGSEHPGGSPTTPGYHSPCPTGPPARGCQWPGPGREAPWPAPQPQRASLLPPWSPKPSGRPLTLLPGTPTSEQPALGSQARQGSRWPQQLLTHLGVRGGGVPAISSGACPLAAPPLPLAALNSSR